MPNIVDIGFTIDEFWNMTLKEMLDYLKIYSKKLKYEQEQKVFLAYEISSLTAAFISNSFNGEQIPSFYELFPNYETEEHKEKERIKAIEAYKAQMIAFANNFNKNKK